MYTSPAVNASTWDSTDINRLAIHYIVDGHPLCSRKLAALFMDGTDEVTCKRCIRKYASM